ncbi:hypothetical protein GALMADRAFT_46618, partial [Galerina marginata CBS 339.88]
ACVCADTRTKWDILWSCLVTNFACSWVSVHPNIPDALLWNKAFRHLKLLFWSIISPELVIFWAAKQWLGAREPAKEYSEYGWTKTHGYFIQMGGFFFYDGERTVGVLGPVQLRTRLRKNEILMPTITEKEINDRSKGDGLSKAIVLVQMAWFLAQCIARKVEGLDIIELELVTLAFAALNSIMYAFWWNNPLNVQITVPVYLLPPPLPLTETFKTTVERPVSGEVQPGSAEAQNESTEVLAGISGERPEPDEVQPEPAEAHANHPRDIVDKIRFRTKWRMFVITKFASGIASSTIDEGASAVGTFYADNSGSGHFWMVFPVVGVVFGSIHCAGWHFPFISPVEGKVWRACSVAITGIP